MEHNQETEQVAMVTPPNVLGSRPLPLSGNREIQKTRKILIIYLSISLSISGMWLFFAISICSVDERKTTCLTALFLPFSLLSYGFGIFVVHRYSTTGLLVLAWTTMLQHLPNGYFITFFWNEFVKPSTVLDYGVISLIVCIGILYTVQCFLLIMEHSATRRLARLINLHKSSVNQQA